MWVDYVRIAVFVRCAFLQTHTIYCFWLYCFWREYYRGDIIEISDATTPTEYTVAMETSEHIEHLREEHLSPYTPITEGDRVRGCFVEGFQECFPGTVMRVYPDLAVAIAYDDGDFDDRRERNMYYVERLHPQRGYPEHLTYYAPENFR